MLINVDWCPSVHFVLKITPISRALDEWEVFLDNVNRKEIALRLLNFGLTNKDFQFIFIRFDQTWLDLISTHLIPFFQSPSLDFNLRGISFNPAGLSSFYGTIF